MGAETVPEILDGLSQFGLIVFDRQHVVGAALLNRPGNGRLCAHGFDGDRAASQRQGRQQLGNGRNFIGLLGCSSLPQHHPGPGSKGRNHVRHRGIDAF